MDTEDKIRVMEAYLEEKVIQQRAINSSEWEDVFKPSWDWVNYEYRVKPYCKSLLSLQLWDHKISRMFDIVEINFNRGIAYSRERIRFKLNDYTLRMYTGVFDSKGIFIYEGDILQDADNTIAHIFYSVEKASFLVRVVSENRDLFLYRWMDYNKAIRVIGNIYENPELLENCLD